MTDAGKNLHPWVVPSEKTGLLKTGLPPFRSGFVTEVHHINEKAEDAGVVYAEVRPCNRALSLSYLTVNVSFFAE